MYEGINDTKNGVIFLHLLLLLPLSTCYKQIIFLHLLLLLPSSFYEQIVCHFSCIFCFCSRLRHFTNQWCVIFLHLLLLPSFYEQMVSRFPAFVAASVILRTNDVSFSCFFAACITFVYEQVSLYFLTCLHHFSGFEANSLARSQISHYGNCLFS
jgi:hypothetical protein